MQVMTFVDLLNHVFYNVVTGTSDKSVNIACHFVNIYINNYIDSNSIYMIYKLY